VKNDDRITGRLFMMPLSKTNVIQLTTANILSNPILSYPILSYPQSINKYLALSSCFDRSASSRWASLSQLTAACNRDKIAERSQGKSELLSDHGSGHKLRRTETYGIRRGRRGFKGFLASSGRQRQKAHHRTVECIQQSIVQYGIVQYSRE
jgi:hypothetical protein